MHGIVAQLLQPTSLLILALVVTFSFACWQKALKRGTLLLLGTLLGLLYFSTTPAAGFLATRSLEWPYLSADVVPGPNDTIVVLSGSLQRDDDSGEHVRVGPDTFYRCYHAAHLYQKAGHCRMLLTGGKVDSSGPEPSLAKVMQGFVIELGVAPSDVVLEEQAKTTHENASFSKDLLDQSDGGRVFLITDAAHMRRAVYSFEAQGVSVIPAPCNYRSRWFVLGPDDFFPSTKGIVEVNYAAHEWQGLAWYRLRSFFSGQ